MRLYFTVVAICHRLLHMKGITFGIWVVVEVRPQAETWRRNALTVHHVEGEADQ
jgi:hypothetical protein